MIRLFTSYYRELNEHRRSELIECLRRNLANPAIDIVCVMLEGVDSPVEGHSKLVTKPVKHRPQYKDFFNWANEVLVSDADVSIVANSDICFDSSMAAIMRPLSAIQCAALARWDIQTDNTFRLFDRNDSQDAWVFRGRIRPVVANFCVGIPRCDNRILYELRAAGYEVINPAFSVRARHLHIGERGAYPAKINGPHVDPPYAYLWPHNLMSLPETLWYRWRHPEANLGWRFDWRRLQRTLPWRVWKRLSRQLSVASRQQ